MSSFPGAYNFEIKQPTWSESLVWKIGGVAVDLTGYTITLRVKFASGAVSYSTAQGVAGNVSGVISWTLDTSAWPAGPVSYDLKAASGDGSLDWLLAGTVTVTP